MNLRFKKWVDNKGGADQVALLLGVRGHTVRLWLRGESCPRAETVIKILELSEGEFTFKQFHNEATRNRRTTKQS